MPQLLKSLSPSSQPSIAEHAGAGDASASKNALEVVQEIVRSLCLDDAMFTLVSHPADPDWQMRHRTAEERISNLADGLRSSRPAGVSIPGAVLLRLVLDDLKAYRAAPDHVISISSRLGGSAAQRHLALMDVHLDEYIPPDRLQNAVQEICGEGREFRLLQTNRYYHVYGCFLLDEREWCQWNLRFLMSDALVYSRYTGQSLLWGCNLLRLNAGPEPLTTVPVTFAVDRPQHGPLARAALELAQRQHRGQSRKNRQPIIYHLEEVAELAVEIGRELVPSDGTSADELYACGYLHDCIEDTNTDYDDVVEAVGERMAECVVSVTEDKRLPAGERHARYRWQLRRAKPAAKIVKLADLVSNLRGLTGHEDRAWAGRYLAQVRRQLDILRDDLGTCAAYADAERWLRAARKRLDQPPPSVTDATVAGNRAGIQSEPAEHQP